MRAHLAFLLALQLLPAALLFQVQLFVDQQRVEDRGQVAVSYDTVLQCSARSTSLRDLSYQLSALYLRLQHVTEQANTHVTYTNLVSLSVEDIGWDLLVTLTGVSDLTTLRCDMSLLSSSSSQATSYQLLAAAYVTLSPSSLLTPPPLPPGTAALVRLGAGATSAPAPTDSLALGSTYMVYILVIIIFVSTLATTGAVACWLSARVRGNRSRLHRIRVARLRDLREAISASQDPVVLTNMSLSRREDAPPPYEGAPVNTTISLRIDSAPPCYQEALSQIAGHPQEDTGDPPPSFETVSPSGTSSLESSAEETDQLIAAPANQL